MFNIKTFEDALEYYSLCRSMRYDLPDGQWDDLKDGVIDLIQTYGKDPLAWPEEVKDEFTATCADNCINWA